MVTALGQMLVRLDLQSGRGVTCGFVIRHPVMATAVPCLHGDCKSARTGLDVLSVVLLDEVEDESDKCGGRHQNECVEHRAPQAAGSAVWCQWRAVFLFLAFLFLRSGG